MSDEMAMASVSSLMGFILGLVCVIAWGFVTGLLISVGLDLVVPAALTMLWMHFRP